MAFAYADLRLKFMTVLMLIVLAVSVTITVMRFGLNPLWADHFVPELSAHYQTSAMFAAFYGLLNFYVFTMAFVYSPSRNAVYGQLPLLSVFSSSTTFDIRFAGLFSRITQGLAGSPQVNFWGFLEQVLNRLDKRHIRQ